MHIFNFYKISGQWFMDDPDYLQQGGNPGYLDVVGGMNDLLECVAQDNSAVQLMADIIPFEDADKMVLMESSGGNSGGYYMLHSLKGQVMDQELWLNSLIYYYFGQLPPTIYVRFN